MTILVSISPGADTARLRRYERGPKGGVLCTHEGNYAPDGIRLDNVEFYRVAGARQDRLGHRSQDGRAAFMRAIP